MDAIAAIYGYYAIHSHVTFDVSPPSGEHWRARFEAESAAGRYETVVAEVDEQVVGFAKTSRFRERAAYDPSVEVSVYRAHDTTIGRLGSALYGALFERIGDKGFHRAYAAIAIPNDASIALHERFGFARAGTFHEVGRKFDRWWDVAWYQKSL